MFIAPPVESRRSLRVILLDEPEGIAMETLGGIQPQGGIFRVLQYQALEHLQVGR